MKDKTWARHSNPWSGWTRLVTYPLLYIPLWYHNWYALGAVVLWFALNPRIFPKPRSTDNWASKTVLGEKLWTRKWRWDVNMLLAWAVAPFFFGAVYAAYMNLFWPMMFCAGCAFLLKMWFVDRMVFYYEEHQRNPG